MICYYCNQVFSRSGDQATCKINGQIISNLLSKKPCRDCPLEKPIRVGDLVKDEDGNNGIVVIKWNDDLCALENDAAHPNPKIVEHWSPKKIEEEEEDGVPDTRADEEKYYPKPSKEKIDYGPI